MNLRHYQQQLIPTTLLPDASEDEVSQVSSQVVALKEHLLLLEVQSWMLSFGNVWESDLKTWGLEKFSVAFSTSFMGKPMLGAHLWIEGKRWDYSGDISGLHDDSGEPMKGKLAERWVDFVKEEMSAFPTQENEEGRWSALQSPRGFDLQEWRNRVLHILPPAQRAQYEQVELDDRTPNTPSRPGLGRL